ncbi:TNF receptor-associated factor 3-like [Dendronephthya gigantea]|uniref:TNF receptor-associated factor 3-like n=1 Tax=Dendronephthya gigantea TaxID=151771 RepID=UPI00106A1870|nr:TNF receptor-associated factor 3-like [Dendronephthya gigantea]
MASSVVQGQGSGFDENRFDGPVSENFKCTICFNVLNDPKSCQNNQHYFCSACIHQYVQNYSQTCPECRQELTVETLVTPPRILLNCISELPIKCDHVERGCTARVQLEKLKNHLDECGFAPVTCANDGCDAVVNKRDRIHHETELCEFRRVQCHNCEELRNEMSRLSEKQENLSKTTGQKLVKLEGKLDQVTTRLQTIEGNVMSKITGLNLAHERGNASVVQEINEIKGFMSDVLHKLSDINNVVCQNQASETQEKENNKRGDERVGGLAVALDDKKGDERFGGLTVALDDKKDSSAEIKKNDELMQHSKTQDSSVGESPKCNIPAWSPKDYDGNDNSDDVPRPWYVPTLTPRKERFRLNKKGRAADAVVAQSSPRSKPKTHRNIEIGMQVAVSRLNGNLSVIGTVRYVGTLPLDREKIYVGVELDFANGDNDGVFDGKRYFWCRLNHGVFCPIGHVTPL